MEDKGKPAAPAKETEQAAGQEAVKKEPEKEALKDTDTLPSEKNEAKKPKAGKGKKAEPPKKTGKIIGLMGIEHDEGPPGSSHG